MERWSKKKIPLFRIVLVIGVFFLLILICYFWILPCFTFAQMEEAEHVSVWGERMDFSVSDKSIAQAVVSQMSKGAWKRVYTLRNPNGLPDLSVLLDGKYVCSYKIVNETCFVTLYYRRSLVQIGVFELALEEYDNYVNYLKSIVSEGVIQFS